MVTESISIRHFPCNLSAEWLRISSLVSNGVNLPLFDQWLNGGSTRYCPQLRRVKAYCLTFRLWSDNKTGCFTSTRTTYIKLESKLSFRCLYLRGLKGDLCYQRSGKIRTCDFMRSRHVLYQAELHSTFKGGIRSHDLPPSPITTQLLMLTRA